MKTRFTKPTYIIFISAFISSCSWVKPFCQEELWCTPNGVFNSVQEAVKVDLSQESIGYWDDYVGNLQPQFQMTTEKALSLAMPKTSYAQNTLAEILSIGIQAGLPQTTTTNTLTQTLGSGLTTKNDLSHTLTTDLTQGVSIDKNGTVTTGSSSYDNKGSQTNTSSTSGNQSTNQSTTSSLAPGTLPTSNLSSVTLPNATSLVTPTGTLAYDPIVTYKTASAIYEEVQLLNAYVKNAAMRQDATPFVARVQLTIKPYAHNEPYDVYIKLDNWAGCESKDQSQTPERIPVTVLPLFVTDNLEVSQTASALSAAKQLAANLGGVFNNVALQGQISDLISKYNAILGSDINSLFTVGRAAENALSVRIGAARIPKLSDKAEYGMLTQNHSVSFVVFVPNEFITNNKLFSKMEDTEKYLTQNCHVDILSSTELRHAVTGEKLQSGSPRSEEFMDKVSHVIGIDVEYKDTMEATQKNNKELFEATEAFNNLNSISQQEVSSSLEKNKLNKSIQQPPSFSITSILSAKKSIDKMILCKSYSESDWKKRAYITDIYEMVASGDVDSYKKFKTCYKPNRFPESIWGELQEVIKNNISDHASAHFDLPKSPLSRLMSTVYSQPIWLVDNGDKGTSITVRGLEDIKPSQITAYLSSLSDQNVKISPSAISQSVDSSIDLTFPPFDTFFDGPKPDVKRRLNGFELVLKEKANRWESSYAGIPFNNLFYDKPAKVDSPDGSVKLAAAVDTLVTDTTGLGKLRIMVQGGADVQTLKVSIYGAALNNSLIAATDIDKSGASLKLNSSKSSTSYDIPLQSLVPGRAAIITLVGLDVKGTPLGQASITIPIVSLAKNSSGQAAN